MTILNKTTPLNAAALLPDGDQILEYFTALFDGAHRDAYLPNRAVVEGQPRDVVDAYDTPPWAEPIVDIEATAKKAADHPVGTGCFAPIASVIGPSDCSDDAVLKTYATHADPVAKPGYVPARCIVEAFSLSVRTPDHNQAKMKALAKLIGPPTLVVNEGPEAAGEGFLIAHWRLRTPVTGYDLLHLHDARKLAAMICGGDMEAANPAYCFRVPGTWNRTGVPVLAFIVERNAGADRDLTTALAAINAAYRQ